MLRPLRQFIHAVSLIQVHRTLGRHISNIRSLRRGYWHASQLALVHTLYAAGANNVWEHFLLDGDGHSAAEQQKYRKPAPR